MSVPALQRADFRYTRYFCEENIWWLARTLLESGFGIDQAQVWLITNPAQSVVLLNQRAARPGWPMVWDYHVILQADLETIPSILDFDTRLDFVTPQDAYLRATFPTQSLLRESYRSWVRTVPVAGYLAHFCSDRSHMRGHLAANAFPDYPIIHAQDGVEPISLKRYLDLQAVLGDGSRVQRLTALHPELM